MRGSAVLCVLGLGAALGSLTAADAAATVKTKPVGTHRNVRLVEPAGAHPRAPVGSQRRPGRTVTARAVRHSLPR
jgi:cobalamin biosynthesis protein CbiD